MDTKYAKYLIAETKNYFSENAEAFSGSRNYLWPELEDLKKYTKEGERILDLGCGNGRLFELFSGEKSIEYIGLDSSEEFIAKAREKYGNHFKVADLLKIPFPDNHFDSIWSVAVLPHIPSKQFRIKALREIERVLKKNGQVIIICWNLYQLRYLRILLKFTIRKLVGLSKLDFKDILLTPKKMGIRRYYHAFTRRELKKLLKETGFSIKKIEFLKRKDKKVNILAVGLKCDIIKL